jgi:hypothetical protein
MQPTLSPDDTAPMSVVDAFATTIPAPPPECSSIAPLPIWTPPSDDFARLVDLDDE